MRVEAGYGRLEVSFQPMNDRFQSHATLVSKEAIYDHQGQSGTAAVAIGMNSLQGAQSLHTRLGEVITEWKAHDEAMRLRHVAAGEAERESGWSHVIEAWRVWDRDHQAGLDVAF